MLRHPVCCCWCCFYPPTSLLALPLPATLAPTANSYCTLPTSLLLMMLLTSELTYCLIPSSLAAPPAPPPLLPQPPPYPSAICCCCSVATSLLALTTHPCRCRHSRHLDPLPLSLGKSACHLIEPASAHCCCRCCWCCYCNAATSMLALTTPILTAAAAVCLITH